MARSYKVTYQVDAKPAESAIARVNKGLEQGEKSAGRLVQSMQRAFDVAGRSAEGAASRITAVNEALAAGAVKSTAKVAAAHSKGAAKVAQDWERANDKINRLFDQEAAAAGRSAQAKATAAAKTVTDWEKANDKINSLFERESKARDAEVTKGMVGHDQLRASGLKMQDNLARAAAKRATAEDRIRTKALTDDQVALRVRNRQVELSNQQRVSGAMKAAGVETKGFMSVAGAIALTQAGMQKLLEMAQAVGQAMTDAAERQMQIAKGFREQRDDLGELAAVQDKPLNNQFTLDFARFNRRAMMKPEESKKFQTEFYNSGAQYIGPGKHISEEQGARFKEMAAKFAVSTHMEPTVIGDLAGQILASTDFNKHGAREIELRLPDRQAGPRCQPRPAPAVRQVRGRHAPGEP
jgi:hypothetical protein